MKSFIFDWIVMTIGIVTVILIPLGIVVALQQYPKITSIVCLLATSLALTAFLRD